MCSRGVTNTILSEAPGRPCLGRLRWILCLGLAAAWSGAPALEVGFASESLPPGSVAVCRVGGLVPESMTLAGFSQEAGFYFSRAEGCWVALLAVPLSAVPGPHALDLRWPGGGQSLSLSVLPDSCARVGNLTVAGLGRRLHRARAGGDRRLLSRGEAGAVARPLWRGCFRWPLDGTVTVTSPFGERRIYNHGLAAWRHQGVDLRAASGTPVLAANAGVVVLARRHMALTGGTVVLDHGYGLVSAYFHLASVRVRAGQQVPLGFLLGTSGSSGLAQGPHLHFEMRLRGRAVSPLQWLQDKDRDGLLLFPDAGADSPRQTASGPI